MALSPSWLYPRTAISGSAADRTRYPLAASPNSAPEDLMNEHAAYLSGIDLGIEHDLGALELELAGVEYGMVHGIGYGDLGAMTVRAEPGVAGFLSGGYAATRKNIERLKLKLKKLKMEKARKVAAAKWEGRKRRLKRRYDRRIKRAEKRIARIERVMERRIERRQGKGKDLTRRQRRLAALLGKKGRKGKKGKKQSGRYATKSGNLPDADGLPAITRAEDAMLDADMAAEEDADMAAEGDGDLFDMEDDPIYKQPWFLAVAGVVAIGGVIYITRQKPKK